ncbi:uncharacterized protein N7477_005755 [Penicillium maclennaniae]|uniref:uncharacterized protein n=1 Tax=Penicillium maclennaniae TaxID=1343394 RepID=UPI00253FC0B8|nr:uncharacterized protein N7477_005755 [Penicillium maclennaniae]KAJ5670392.1 hypothetical protein N7477_005755 [Penicillium maclennaniae]
MTISEIVTSVLIVGAGPAGANVDIVRLRLCAALWLAQLGIDFRIVDRRSDQPRKGQADGLNPKTMEIFEAFGIHEKITKRWEPGTDEMFWVRGKDGELTRMERLRKKHPHGVRWTHGTLQQGTVEEIMKKRMTKISGITVDYDTSLSTLDIDTSRVGSLEAYPCTVLLQQESGGVPQKKLVQSKYVIGADGGKSTTRNLLGFDMQGERGSSVWGVMDFVGRSDFPDFGATSIIRSDVDGAVDFVRREDGLVRMYVELNKGPEWEGLDRDQITAELIIKKCQFLLRPYTLHVDECVWWSAFTATQRLSSGMSRHRRVFLVGDAVHTHSPLTGMGMNTSLQDSYNLVWKLRGVIKGQLKPEILDTYDTERQVVAKQLLNADRTCLDLFETPIGSEAPSILERAEELIIFLAGRGICYSDPLLTSPSVRQIGLKPGENLPEQELFNHATGRATHLHNALKADGSWCLIVYAGDASSLTKRLGDDKHFSGALCAVDKIILAEFPAIFPPMHRAAGQDYGKICIDETNVYEEAGLNQKTGGVVLVRPDCYIGWVGTLSDFGGLKEYLSRIFQTGSKIHDAHTSA